MIFHIFFFSPRVRVFIIFIPPLCRFFSIYRQPGVQVFFHLFKVFSHYRIVILQAVSGVGRDQIVVGNAVRLEGSVQPLRRGEGLHLVIGSVAE